MRKVCSAAMHDKLRLQAIEGKFCLVSRPSKKSIKLCTIRSVAKMEKIETLCSGNRAAQRTVCNKGHANVVNDQWRDANVDLQRNKREKLERIKQSRWTYSTFTSIGKEN